MQAIALHVATPQWGAESGEAQDVYSNLTQQLWLERMEQIVDPSLALVKMKAPVIKRRKWYKKAVRRFRENAWREWNNLSLPPYIRQTNLDPKRLWPDSSTAGILGIAFLCDMPGCRAPASRTEGAFNTVRRAVRDIPGVERRRIHFCMTCFYQMLWGCLDPDFATQALHEVLFTKKRLHPEI